MSDAIKKATPFQEMTLQDALTKGTYTRNQILQANRKTKPKDILPLFKKGKMDKKVLFEALYLFNIKTLHIHFEW